MHFLYVAAACSTLALPALSGLISRQALTPSTTGFDNATIHRSAGGKSICVSGIVPVKAQTDRNLRFTFGTFENQTLLTATISEATADGSSPKALLAGQQAVGGTYSIGATMCMPETSPNTSAVQFITHGLFAERNYWDFATDYSYVDVATQAGYAAFFYDRVGTGQSQIVDGVNEKQAPLQLEIAIQLIEMLRAGHFGKEYSTVIGVGHSFGSFITQGVTAAAPEAFDATILTGYSVGVLSATNILLSAGLELANENQPWRFHNLPNDYLVLGSAVALQSGFYHFPGYDSDVFWLSHVTQGAITLAEFLSTTSVQRPAKGYTSPVAVVNGAYDFGACAGNCTYPHNLAADVAPALYPDVDADRTDTYIAPLAGHGLVWHYSAYDAHQWIQRFLKEKM